MHESVHRVTSIYIKHVDPDNSLVITRGKAKLGTGGGGQSRVGDEY